jgi:hypothetical protein
MNRCKKREVVELRHELDRQRAEHSHELDRQRAEHSQELARLHAQYAQELDGERKRYSMLEEKYDTQKELADKLQTQLFEIAKQPNTINHNNNVSQTNNRTLNVVQQLGTYDFDEKRMEQILEENFTQDVFLGGPEKIAQFAAQYLLIDPETQKPKVICTDASRKTFRYVDPETQELQVDTGFQKTHRLIRRPLGQANLRVFYDHFLRNDPDDLHRDQWKLNDDFIEDHHRFPEKLHCFLKK